MPVIQSSTEPLYPNCSRFPLVFVWEPTTKNKQKWRRRRWKKDVSKPNASITKCENHVKISAGERIWCFFFVFIEYPCIWMLTRIWVECKVQIACLWMKMRMFCMVLWFYNMHTVRSNVNYTYLYKYQCVYAWHHFWGYMMNTINIVKVISYFIIDCAVVI